MGGSSRRRLSHGYSHQSSRSRHVVVIHQVTMATVISIKPSGTGHQHQASGSHQSHSALSISHHGNRHQSHSALSISHHGNRHQSHPALSISHHGNRHQSHPAPSITIGPTLMQPDVMQAGRQPGSCPLACVAPIAARVLDWGGLEPCTARVRDSARGTHTAIS